MRGGSEVTPERPTSHQVLPHAATRHHQRSVLVEGDLLVGAVAATERPRYSLQP